MRQPPSRQSAYTTWMKTRTRRRCAPPSPCANSSRAADLVAFTDTSTVSTNRTEQNSQRSAQSTLFTPVPGPAPTRMNVPSALSLSRRPTSAPYPADTPDTTAAWSPPSRRRPRALRAERRAPRERSSRLWSSVALALCYAQCRWHSKHAADKHLQVDRAYGKMDRFVRQVGGDGNVLAAKT